MIIGSSTLSFIKKFANGIELSFKMKGWDLLMMIFVLIGFPGVCATATCGCR